MSDEGPALESLMRRLAECPADFLAEPRIGKTGTVHVAAVVGDLLRDLGGPSLTLAEAATFAPRSSELARERNRLRTVLIVAWLLHDPWFRAQGTLAPRVKLLVSKGIEELAELVPPPQLVADAERREELARVALRSLGLRPGGENEAQAQDRLSTVSSSERARVIEAAREAVARAQAIRDAMAQAAEEAAARYSRE